MSPGGHLVTTAVACGAVYGLTGSAALTAGLAAGGFAIDLDHAFDYVVFERQRDVRPSRFLRYYLGGEATRAVLILHSYELIGLLTLLAWVTGWPLLGGYLLGVGLHIPLDIIFNGKFQPRTIVAFYSFIYRWRAGFETARLIGLKPHAPVPAGFWHAFFKGANVAEEGATPVRAAKAGARREETGANATSPGR